MLTHADGSAFSVGRSTYLDRDPGEQSETSRVNVRLDFEGVEILALLDTGAAWSVLNGELAQALGLLERTGEPTRISSRYGSVDGKLVRVSATLVAQEGESVEMEATVFVSSQWKAGTFVGYSGLLERVRFAIDPETNSFYFGSPR